MLYIIRWFKDIRGVIILKKLVASILVVSLLLCATTSYFFSANNSSGRTRPIRIGYVETDNWEDFSYTLAGIALAFQQAGILGDYEINLEEPDSSKVWKDMCDHCISDKYKFVKNMYFDMLYMKESEYSKMVNRDDVDLVLVMGTTAGKYFTEHEEKSNYMVFESADAIAAGIVKSGTERFKSNSYAHIDKTRYVKQLQAAHSLINFKKIGVVYENSESAYVYSAIDQLKDASKKFNFKIETINVDEPKNASDYDRYYKELKQAYKSLANKGVDALYLTSSLIDNNKLLSILNEDIYANNIPTIAQTSEEQVKSGALFGTSITPDFDEMGAFFVEQIREYAENGLAFDKLEQVNEVVPKIYLNYDIAKRIGLKIPFSTMLVIDKLFTKES